MDEVERLIGEFGARGRRNQSVWKLDVLLDLGRIDDPRVVHFLMGVVTDVEEAPDVCTAALRCLREAPLSPGDRVLVAGAVMHGLAPKSDDQVRLHAAVILGDFTDVDGVLGALASVTTDPCEPVELRYNAFTSVQRAGPTAACVDVLRALSTDEVLGQSARALLTSWGIA